MDDTYTWPLPVHLEQGTSLPRIAARKAQGQVILVSYHNLRNNQRATMDIAMNEEQHKARHAILHQHLDELIADWIGHTESLPSKHSVMELIEWSYKQTIHPTPLNEENPAPASK